jgi:hypothetical protein
LVIKALDPDPYWIRIGIQPKMLDPDPDEMNADPQPWSIDFENCYELSSVVKSDFSVAEPEP